MSERKLIRDKMAYTIGLGPGDRISVCKTQKQYEDMLIKKFSEEFLEVRKEIVKSEIDPDKVLEELADLLTVIEHLADTFASASMGTIVKCAEQKANVRGKFNAGIILERKI